jgi:hypothetical protein
MIEIGNTTHLASESKAIPEAIRSLIKETLNKIRRRSPSI